MVLILDFEFYKNFNVSCGPIILISGAIYNGSETIKLEGTPLVLEYNKSPRVITHFELGELHRNIEHIFSTRRNEYLKPIQNQIFISVNSNINNLSQKSIQNLICNYDNDKKQVVVTWNGSTDIEILKLLNIDKNNYRHIDIMAVRQWGNQFALYAYDDNGTVTSVRCLGNINKRGHKLNLKETHDIICKENHQNISIHDPIFDVLMTKCIYDKMFK